MLPNHTDGSTERVNGQGSDTSPVCSRQDMCQIESLDLRVPCKRTPLFRCEMNVWHQVGFISDKRCFTQEKVCIPIEMLPACF